MPPSAAVIARDQRILAGHVAGATILDLAIAEEVDPAVVRRILREAGIAPRPIRKPGPDPAADCLADSTWLRAEYATKGAKRIAKELGCSHDRVYEALHAAGIPMRENGFYPNPQDRITPEVADQIVSLYLAGSSAERVADELGLPVKAVNTLVEERGVKRTRSEVASLAHAQRLKSEATPRDEWPAELQAEILDRYAQGQSGEMIAELLELPASSVYRLLRERGVLRSRGGRGSRVKPKAKTRPAQRVKVDESLPPDLAPEALAHYSEGQPAGAIAVVLGVATKRVYRFLCEAGVLRSRSEAQRFRHAKARAEREREQPPAMGPKRQRAEVPAELVDQVITRYTVGESAQVIAEDLGLKTQWVSELLQKRGVMRSGYETMQRRAEAGAISEYVGKRCERLSPEVEDEILERYAAGDGGTAIVKALGLKQWQVYGLLIEHGVLRDRKEAALLRDAGRRS